MSFEPCSVIAAARMIEIIPDTETLLVKKQLLKNFVDITCKYQSPEATRRDYNWSKLYDILQENFTSENVGEELYKKLVITFNQDEENDK
jgi:hypothetical protein